MQHAKDNSMQDELQTMRNKSSCVVCEINLETQKTLKSKETWCGVGGGMV